MHLALCAMGFWSAGCGTSVAPAAPTTLRVAGSTAMLPLLQDLSEAYVRSGANVRWDIEGGGSRLGLERVQMAEVDLAACSWLPSDDEQESRETSVTVPVAWDGIAIVTHPANPTTDLTLLQLRSIFAGRTLDWSDVGTGYGEIVVVSREDGSGTRAIFEQLVMGDQAVTLTAIVMPSSSAVQSYVASHAAAIGCVSSGLVDPLSSGDDGAPADPPKTSVRVLAIEGALPTPETVHSGVYHLVRPLYLVTAPSPSSDIQGFIDFALSPAGQAVVAARYGRVK